MSDHERLPGEELDPSESADEASTVATYADLYEAAPPKDYAPAVWRRDEWWDQLYERHGDAETDRQGTTVLTLWHDELEHSSTPGLSAGVQLIKPGESAGKHRHTSAALNVVLQGSGYSIVDGEKVEYEQFDTFLAPAWDYHQHVNDGDEDLVIWTVQNRPLFSTLRAQLFQEEGDAEPTQHVRDRD